MTSTQERPRIRDGVYESPPCQRCRRTTFDGAEIIGNLTMFWQGGLYGSQHPTLCRDCIDDIRAFAETPVERCESVPCPFHEPEGAPEPTLVPHGPTGLVGADCDDDLRRRHAGCSACGGVGYAGTPPRVCRREPPF